MDQPRNTLNAVLIGVVIVVVVIALAEAVFILQVNAKENGNMQNSVEKSGDVSSADSDVTESPVRKIGVNEKKSSSMEDWNPFGEMNELQRRISGEFGKSFEAFRGDPRFRELWEKTGFIPGLDLKEERERYIVKLDLPGIKKEDMEIGVENGVLSIEGERREATEKKNAKEEEMIKQRVFGKFSRYVRLPEPVKADELKTEYKDGVLTVTIPKEKPSEPRIDQLFSEHPFADEYFTKPFDPDEWTPLEEMRELHMRMDDMFRRAVRRFGKSDRYKKFFEDGAFSPKVDLEETDAEYILRVDVPGVDESAIKVKMDAGVLKIEGSRERKMKKEEGEVRRMERIFGEFSASIDIPKPVIEDGMKKDIKNGVLTVTLPKKKK